MLATPKFDMSEVAYRNGAMVLVPDDVAAGRRDYLHQRETFPIQVGDRLQEAFMVSVSAAGAMTVAPAYCLIPPGGDHSWIVDEVAPARANPRSISGPERDRIEAQLRQSLRDDQNAPTDPDQCGMWIDHWSDELVKKTLGSKR